MNNDFDNFGEPEQPRPNPEGRSSGDRSENPAPRRRPRPDEFDRDMQDAPKEMSVLGLLSLLQGVGSLLASFVPCVGVLGIIGGGFGLLLGIIGYFVAKGSTRQSNSLPIAGIVVNGLAILIGGLWLYWMVGVFKQVDDEIDLGGEPFAVLTAIKLDEEYNANELAADTKYKQKVLVVSGKIKTITRDITPGQVTVELVGVVLNDREPSNSVVFCNFNTLFATDLKPFDVGQDISIRGTCKGKINGWVTLNKCSVVTQPNKKDGDPITLTASELDDAYDGNIESADKKYKGKTLILSGEVLRVSRDRPGKTTVEMDTTTGTLDCDFVSKDHRAQLELLVPEQRVVIRGVCLGKVNDVVILDQCVLVKK